VLAELPQAQITAQQADAAKLSSNTLRGDVMPKMRVAVIVHNGVPVNTVVLSPDPVAAAAYCAAFDGLCVIRDPDDEYGTEFVTLTGCVAVEVTDLAPQPGVGTGWTYVEGEWVAPAEPTVP
jgi:hypothetical protein